MVRIALAGIGGYGDNYLAELLENTQPGIEFAGICDPYAQRSPRYKQIREKNVPVFNTLEEYFLFEEKAGRKTGLTVISTPIHTHHDFIQCALKHNSNVLCEKPPCATVEEITDLMKQETGMSCFVAVGYQQCFSRDTLELKRDILSGMFGKPLLFKSLRLMRRGMSYYRRNNWAGKKTVSGIPVFDSPLSNACAHEFQTMLFLLGPAMGESADLNSLEAVLYKANPEIENFDAVALQADVGIPVLFYAAHCVSREKTGPMSSYRFEKATVLCEKGFCAYAPDGSVLKEYRTLEGERRMQKLFDCITAIEHNVKPVCSLKTSLSHIKTVEAVQRLSVVQITEPELVAWADETDSYYSVKNLEDNFLRCYETETLPKRDVVYR